MNHLKLLLGLILVCAPYLAKAEIPQVYLNLCVVANSAADFEEFQFFTARLVFPSAVSQNWKARFGSDLIYFEGARNSGQEYERCSLLKSLLPHESATNYNIQIADGDYGDRTVVANLIQLIPIVSNESSNERFRTQHISTVELRVGGQPNMRIGSISLNGKDGSVPDTLKMQ